MSLELWSRSLGFMRLALSLKVGVNRLCHKQKQAAGKAAAMSISSNEPRNLSDRVQGELFKADAMEEKGERARMVSCNPPMT
jgi:hypothetical protein